MLFSRLFKKKDKKPQNPLGYLKKNYTNEITIQDLDHREINIKVRDVGNDKTFLIITNMKTKEEMVFDFDGAIVLNAIITDYVENGNLNKVEEIFSEEQEEEQQGEKL